MNIINFQQGDTFGKLSFIKIVKHDSPRKALMICSCGKETEVWVSNLTSGHTKSCGCLIAETSSVNNKTHGMSETKEYKCWQDMVYRVTSPKAESYEKYAALGIFQEWLTSFESFFEHIGPQPVENKRWSIGRIKNSVGYFPDNVRWEDGYQQNRNRHKTKANTSGVTGVQIRRNRDNGLIAVATWYDVTGKQRSKSFCESKYGDVYFNMAVSYRLRKIEELNSLGAGYSEEHGQDFVKEFNA